MKQLVVKVCSWMLHRIKKYSMRIYRVTIAKYIEMLIDRKPLFKEYRVDEVFMNQNKENGYRRVDLLICLLAIESEKCTDRGWQMYIKMLKAQGYSEKRIKNKKKRFLEIIKAEDGKRIETIVVDRDINLHSGCQKLALAIHYGEERVRCYVRKGFESDRIYDLNWARCHGFADSDLKCIIDKQKELVERYKVRISLMLWPPVYEYFDEIEDCIHNGLCNDIPIIKDFNLSDEPFSKLVRAIYSTDDVEKWKIEKKLSYMDRYYPKTIRYIELLFDHPRFRPKRKNGNLILVQGEQLKSVIRSEYQRRVENYYYDIICHTSDNVAQGQIINRMFFPLFNLEDYLNQISNCKYIIIKLNTPNQTNDFPRTFAFGKDLDIVCSRSDYDRIIRITEKYINAIKDSIYDITIIEDSSNSERFRIEINEHLVFQIDIGCEISGINNKYIDECIHRREQIDNYFVASIPDEIVFRALYFMKSPDKTYHLDYILDNASRLDVDLLMQFDFGRDFYKSNIESAH